MVSGIYHSMKSTRPGTRQSVKRILSMLYPTLRLKKIKIPSLQVLTGVGPAFPIFFVKFLPRDLRHRFSPGRGQGFYVTEILAEAIFLVFIFLALGGLTAGRKDAGATLVWTLFYAVLWVFWLGLIRWSSQRLKSAAYFRGFGPWIAVMLSYNLVGKLIRLVHPAIYDDRLQDWS